MKLFTESEASEVNINNGHCGYIKFTRFGFYQSVVPRSHTSSGMFSMASIYHFN